MLRTFINALTGPAPKGRAQGIDISHHNKSFNPSGTPQRLDFVFQKVTEGYIKADGTMWIDPLIDQLWQGTRLVPVRIAYHYQRAGVSWLRQANHFQQVADRYDFQGYAVDVERVFNVNSDGSWITGDTFFADTRRIIDYLGIIDPGKRVLLYTNPDTWRQMIAAIGRTYGREGIAWLLEQEIWLAQYWYLWSVDKEPAVPIDMIQGWRFWQITEAARGADWGVGSSTVDVDVYNGTPAELHAWMDVAATPLPPPAPEPTPAPIPEADIWSGTIITSTRMVVRTYPERRDGTDSGLRLSPGQRIAGYLWSGNGHVWCQLVAPETCSGKWIAVRELDGNPRYIRLDPQDEAPTIPPPTSPDLYRLMKWGDPILVKEASRDAGGLGTASQSNFQAIGLYNKATNTMGGVSNWLRIPHADVMRLHDLQRTDWAGYTAAQKMNWLVKDIGTIYFYGDREGDWQTLDWVKWGTIGLGNNLVRVVDTEIFAIKTPDGVRRTRKMAKLAGFRSSDWGKPLDELVAQGLVHRCYCVYGADNHIGDTPKGIVYSPFWSPLDWRMGGTDVQPDAFWLPIDWLIKV